MTGLLLIAAAAAVLALVAGAAIALLRSQRTRALRRFALATTLVLLYTAALIAVGIASRPSALSAGQWKCFDDWCITLRTTTETATGRQLTWAVRNAGRGRAQRPDSPHVILERAGRPPVSVAVTGLDRLLTAGQTTALTCVVEWTGPGRLVVTEGGWPSRLVIGDQNSPWHARSGWNL